jgi:hypothetical protein
VRGYAAQRLRVLNNPLDASNRRISVIVQYVEKARNSADDTVTKEGETRKDEPKKE